MFGFPTTKDRIITLLSSQVSDLQGMLERIQREHAAQVRDLTDKLVAVSSPPAFRSLQGATAPERTTTPPRAYLPGYRQSFRPPDPETPPTGKPVASAPRERVSPEPVEISPPDDGKGN